MAEKYVGAFGVIPNAILYDKRLKNGEKILYTFISSLSNKSGYCFASNAYLSEAVGVTKNTIVIYLKHLEDLGYIYRNFKASKNDNANVERKIYLNYDGLFNKDEEDPTRKSGRGVPENQVGGYTKIVEGATRKSGSIIIQDNNTNIKIQNNNTPEEAAAKKYNYTLIAGKFIEIANEYGLSIISKLSDKRKAKLKARLDELGEDKIIEAIDKIKESSFLRGENDRKWKVDFDWLIANDTNILKVLEDKYKDEEKPEEDDPWKKVGYRF